MKKIRYAALAGALLLALTGCAKTATVSAPTLGVVVEESPWAVIENNGQTVRQGEDVTFRIETTDGFVVLGTDYEGEETLSQDGSNATLTLHNVSYPTRLRLTLSNENYVLRYDPNGGQGEAFTEIQQKKNHARPNTANAAVSFSRPGYTLLGWNTKPDGSGTAAGLGSRITAGEEGITLYAQWAKWTEESCFTWQEEQSGAVITGCDFQGDTLVIPGQLSGLPVTRLAAGAFETCTAQTVVFPESLRVADKGSFSGAPVRELYLFDSIQEISDDTFGSPGVQTLHINAARLPAGAAKYKESCYADKLDLLILSQEQNRVIFYGGCSMWYNLDMLMVLRTLGEEWYPVDIALNGTVSSELQLQMMLPYVHAGDVFFHTPEFASDAQMMRTTELGNNEERLWAGVEYNYDLLAAADLRAVTGELDSLCRYWNSRKEETTYDAHYLDSKGRAYFGPCGEIPFIRYEPEGNVLSDDVRLNVGLISDESMERLEQWYARFQEKGVSVFVSFACVNLDALTEEERGNVHAVDEAFREAIGNMPGVVLLSDLMHFVYHNGHFYDTNYHLLSDTIGSCTKNWVKNLKPYLDDLNA